MWSAVTSEAQVQDQAYMMLPTPALLSPKQSREFGAEEEEEDETEISQLASVPGAPIEKINPLGHEVTLLSAVMLNVGQIIGSGIFSVPGVILHSVGSIGLFFVAWLLAPIFAFAGVMLYSELASMFPNRSGGEVVYLEQAYPRPKFLVPISYAACSVLMSSTALNAIVFAQYVLHGFDAPITPFNQAAVAIGVSAFATTMATLSTKWSLKAVNVFSSFKLLSLAFIVVTGMVVLAGGTRIEHPFANFQNAFRGSNYNPHSLATALVKTNMTFTGWHNAFRIVAEVKSGDPVRVVSRAGYIALLLATLLFLCTNVAYVAAVPLEEMRGSGQLVAALFFRNVLGDTLAARILPFMVACSCLGNIIAVTVGHSRVLREIARQGLLPFASFFSSTKPFGTPLGPALIKFSMTALVVSLLPAKDAFNFMADLASYPDLVFITAMIIGVWLLRRRRARAGLPPGAYQAWDVAISLYLLLAVLLLVMPWVPPEPGHSDVSFWYATYCVAGLGILLLCGLYYYLYIVFLPNCGGYEIVEEVEEFSDGARIARLVRRYKDSNLSGEEVAEEDRALLAS